MTRHLGDTAPRGVVDRRPRPEDVGLRGLMVAIGAAAALVVIALLVVRTAPLRDEVATIRGEGSIAPLLSRARDPSKGRADELAAFHAVRTELEPVFAERSAALEQVGRDLDASLAPGLERLRLWSELKRAWARSLAREGLSSDAYARLARAAPHPMDRFLVKDLR